jgi:hypothetical protein
LRTRGQRIDQVLAIDYPVPATRAPLRQRRAVDDSVRITVEFYLHMIASLAKRKRMMNQQQVVGKHQIPVVLIGA